MDHPKIIIILSCSSLIACAPAMQGVQDVIWDIQKKMSKPGEKSLTLPEEIWDKYDCDHLRRPFIAVETFEVIPRRLHPGEEFNQRLIYALCSNRRADEVTGALHTRIYFKGTPVVNDLVENYSVKPGRWRVNTFIALPRTAENGVYSIEVRFSSTYLRFRESETFVVH